MPSCEPGGLPPPAGRPWPRLPWPGRGRADSDASEGGGGVGRGEGRRLSSAAARAVAYAALALVLLGILLTSRRFPGNDLDVYRRAAARFLAGTLDMYPRPDPEGYGYSYAPGVAPLLIPFLAVPRAVARAGWMLATCALALLSAHLVDRLRPSTTLRYAQGERKEIPFTLRVGGEAAVVEARGLGALALVLLARCIADDVRNANVNVATLAVVLAALLALERGRDARAGLLLALAAVVKVTPALVAIDWALRRRWRALAALGAGVAAVAAMPALRYGPSRTVELHARWLASQRWAAPLEAFSPANQSLWSMAARYGLGSGAAAAACVALVALAASARSADGRRPAALLLCAALVTANGWPQNLVWAAPLTALLLGEGGVVAGAAALLAASTFLLGGDVIGLARAERVQAAKAYGLAMIALLAIARLTQRMSPDRLHGRCRSNAARLDFFAGRKGSPGE